MNDPVMIGQLRKDAADIELLFEAVRVALELGHDISVNQGADPIPPPEGEEREWDKKRREENSAVIWFWVEK